MGFCWPIVGAHWYVLVFLWSHWVLLVRGGFWRKRPSNRSSWAKKFCAGVDIPALNVADNRSASKSLHCHLTALEPCTEAFSKSSVVGRLRAGMALIAALSGSERLSPPGVSSRASWATAATSDRMDRGTEFSRARRLSAPVGLRREGSKSAITSHENCCRAERSAHGSLVQNIFVRSIDQLMATTHASICRCLDHGPLHRPHEGR